MGAGASVSNEEGAACDDAEIELTEEDFKNMAGGPPDDSDVADEDEEEGSDQEDDEDAGIAEKMIVRVKEDVEKPKFGWGRVKPGDKGIVVSVTGAKAKVNFPSQKGWKGLVEELEEVEAAEIEEGMRVRVMRTILKPRFNWGKVKAGDIGTVKSVNVEAGTLRVNFDRQKNWKGAIAEMEVVEDADEDTIEVGDHVTVKPQVKVPKYQWGKVQPGNIGVVTSVDDQKLRIDFKRQKNWLGWLPDLEKVDGDAEDQVDPAEEEWKAQGFVPGALIKVKDDVETPKYKWGKVKPGMAGKIRELVGDDVYVEFPVCGKPWKGHLPEMELYVEAAAEEEEEDVSDEECELFEDGLAEEIAPGIEKWVRPGRGDGFLDFAVGDIVKVKDSVEEPKAKWGGAKRGQEGPVLNLKSGGRICVVDFETHKNWQGYSCEMERVSGDSSAVSLFQTISPNDIKQGSLGDCWLLAAFASLAEFPVCVREVFGRPDLSKRGKYKIKLFDLNTKEWKTVTVDDRLPANDDGGGLKYAGTSECGELWVPILEKACAALFGSYEKLKGGWGPTGWATLLGCTDCYSLRKKDEGWVRRKIVWKDNDNLQYQWAKWADGSVGHAAKSQEDLLSLLAGWDRQHFLMCASGHAADSDSHKVENIVQSHEYSLIAVVQDACGEGVDLVQLRNPWGRCEWQGAWSDNAPEWDEHPEIKTKYLQEKGDDGLFWMPASDFFRLFDAICIMEKPMPLEG